MKTIIENELCEGFERELFSAAQNNLSDKSNPLRLNNYSYAMRELSRHVLHRLAPDQNVINCSWYKNETDKENGITRKQRAYYAVQGGLDDQYVKETLGLEVDGIHSRLVKAINNLSKFTHIEPKVFNLSELEAEQFVVEMTEATHNFLIAIRECRELIIEQLWEQIDAAVIDKALTDTITSIDELASHHYIEEINTDTIKIFNIDHESILLCAYGSIGCELQWGSNSDIRRGDGATLHQSFPFTCQLISSVEAPDEIECDENSLSVDTSSWYDLMYGQDEFSDIDE